MLDHPLPRLRLWLAFLLVVLTVIPRAFGGDNDAVLYRSDFGRAKLGSTPAGWRDLIDDHASRSWAVDGRGLLRTLLKQREGTIAYDGALADASPAKTIKDGIARVTFKKTPDPTVSISVVGRLQDKGNYYAARFTGLNQLEIVKVKAGEAKALVSNVTRHYCLDQKPWQLVLEMRGPVLTARVIDEKGVEQARVDARDEEFAQGAVGLRATEFAAAADFTIAPVGPMQVKLSAEEVAAKNDAIAKAAGVQAYAIVKPAEKVDSLNTPFDKLRDRYDVIVAGGGTGGSAAAIQAARMGAKVLLIDESDWIGGQMSAAAVTTMDEEGIWFQFPVRERGFYREFHESMLNYYYALQMDPYRAYASWPIQTEGGYEPKKTRAALYAFIDHARKATKDGVLDVCPSTRVAQVRKNGEAITGVTLENWTADAAKPRSRELACHVVIEATEYGDVLPVAGARYRVGNSTSDSIDHAAYMQDNTWSAVIREYPAGVPDHLKVKTPPPGYERVGKLFKKYQRAGLYIWGPPSKGIKGPRDWRVYFRWRGMADSDSDMTGTGTEFRHTQCGLNGGNDYEMRVADLEDPAKRLANERHGIYLTLGIIHYFQHELGVNWGLAEDEGYNTPYNQRMMKRRELAPEFEKLAVHMPQWPYVRESRRAVGMYTLRAADMGRFENAKHWPTSLAMGDYFMDLHRSEEYLEHDLDPGSWANNDFAKGGGPFQVPFEVFIPEKVDGLVLAEKNIAQSRLVSGATRLQPITMLTGQAAGAIAALAAQQQIQPRALNPVDAQVALLKEGSTLVPRWYIDAPWGTQVWRDSQLLSLYGILDRSAPIHKRNGPLREKWTWGPNDAVTSADAQDAAAKLARLSKAEVASSAGGGGGGSDAAVVAADKSGPVTREQMVKLLGGVRPAWEDLAQSVPVANEQSVTRKEFAAACARVLLPAR